MYANIQLTINKFWATFPWRDFSIDTSLTFSKFPDISRFSIQVVTLKFVMVLKRWRHLWKDSSNSFTLIISTAPNFYSSKGDELPSNGPCCLCEIFFLLIIIRFQLDSDVCCSGAYSLYCASALARVKPNYGSIWPTLAKRLTDLITSVFNCLGRYASSLVTGYLLCKTHCFFPSNGLEHWLGSWYTSEQSPIRVLTRLNVK